MKKKGTFLGAIWLGIAFALGSCAPPASEEPSNSSQTESGGSFQETVVPSIPARDIIDISLKEKSFALPTFTGEAVAVSLGGKQVEFSKEGEIFTITNLETVPTGETELVVTGEKSYTFTACVATEIIRTVEDFTAMREAEHTINDYYVLANDLDFTGVQYKTKATFSGVFDGRGYALTNYEIFWTNQTSGMFGSEAVGTQEKKTEFKNFAILSVGGGGYGTGAVVDYAKEYTQIENVFVRGALNRGGFREEISTGHNGYIVGRAGANCVIQTCMVVDETGTLSANVYPQRMGLIIGESVSQYPIMRYCYASSVMGRPLINGYYNYECEYAEYENTPLNAYRSETSMYSDVLDRGSVAYLQKIDGYVFWGRTLILSV